MKNARLILLIVPQHSRAITVMALAAHLIGLRAKLVLCVQTLPEGCVVAGEKVSPDFRCGYAWYTRWTCSHLIRSTLSHPLYINPIFFFHLANGTSHKRLQPGKNVPVRLRDAWRCTCFSECRRCSATRDTASWKPPLTFSLSFFSISFFHTSKLFDSPINLFLFLQLVLFNYRQLALFRAKSNLHELRFSNRSGGVSRLNANNLYYFRRRITAFLRTYVHVYIRTRVYKHAKRKNQ